MINRPRAGNPLVSEPMPELAVQRTLPVEVGSSPVPRTDGPAGPTPTEAERELRLRGLVERYIDFVARVLRNAGTPQAEVDDDVQRVFIAVANRLNDVRPGAEKSFLLRTALHIAAHARRTQARRREVPEEEAPERGDAVATPEELTGQKRARLLLDRILSMMGDELRTVFVLYEFEELSMAEIGEALGLPRGTVASRLRRARADFKERLRHIEGPFRTESPE
jgi:RNA polymerase sigma-70 factor (ECF subfamily)